MKISKILSKCSLLTHSPAQHIEISVSLIITILMRYEGFPISYICRWPSLTHNTVDSQIVCMR